MKSYVVIGLGLFGGEIAKKLYELGQEVIAIDKKEEFINEVADSVTRAAVGDATDPQVLKALGVKNCDCAVVAVGSDLGASVLTTMNLKKLGIPYIVCKAQNETHRMILEKIGADQVIIPEHVVADKIARSLATPNIMEYIELSNDYGIIERKAPAGWEGKTLREMNIRAKYGVDIIAVRNGDKIRVTPGADYKFGDESDLVVLGDYDSLEKFKKIK